MTIPCKRCGEAKHRVHFYDSDVARGTNVCRKCRQEYKPKASGLGRAVWQNSNHRFFGEAVRDADDALRYQIRQMRRMAT